MGVSTCSRGRGWGAAVFESGSFSAPFPAVGHLPVRARPCSQGARTEVAEKGRNKTGVTQWCRPAHRGGWWAVLFCKFKITSKWSYFRLFKSKHYLKSHCTFASRQKDDFWAGFELQHPATGLRKERSRSLPCISPRLPTPHTAHQLAGLREEEALPWRWLEAAGKTRREHQTSGGRGLQGT